MSKLITAALLGVLVSSTGCSNPKHRLDTYYVESEGVGETCDLAINNAKHNAIEKVTGTLLQGKRSLIGLDYSESMSEFSGGTIKESKILDVKKTEWCRVMISALVEPGNLQVSGEKGKTSFDLGQLSAKEFKKEESRKIIKDLINRPEMIEVNVGGLRWSKDVNDSLNIQYEIVEILPSLRWYRDLEEFFKVQGVLVRYDKITSSYALSEFFLSNVDKLHRYSAVPSSAQDSEICFKHENYKQFRCYQSSVADYAMSLLDSLYLIQTIKDADGRILQKTDVKPAGLSLFARRGFEEKYSSILGTTHIFNIVEPSNLPISVSNRISKSALVANGKFEVSVGFKVAK